MPSILFRLPIILLHLDLVFLLHHNLLLTPIILDGTGDTNCFTLQVLLRLVGEAAPLVEHDHGRERVVRVLSPHVQEGRPVAQQFGAVHLRADRNRFAD